MPCTGIFIQFGKNLTYFCLHSQELLVGVALNGILQVLLTKMSLKSRRYLFLQ